MLSVIASYYGLFAVSGGSIHTLLVESTVMAMFPGREGEEWVDAVRLIVANMSCVCIVGKFVIGKETLM